MMNKILVVVFSTLTIIFSGFVIYQNQAQKSEIQSVVSGSQTNNQANQQPALSNKVEVNYVEKGNAPELTNNIASSSGTALAEKCEYRKGKYESRVYDSQGRMTGIINDVVKTEIPDSDFDKESGATIMFGATDIYKYEVFCLEEGNYQMEQASVRDGELVEFKAVNIPIFPGELHRYEFDWDALARGEKGGILYIDNNQDGNFEKTIKTGKDFTCQEFLAEQKFN